MKVEISIEGILVGIVIEGISSTLILFWGQFLLQKIYVYIESRQEILEF